MAVATRVYSPKGSGPDGEFSCEDLKDPKFASLRTLIEECITAHFRTALPRFEAWAAMDRNLKALKKPSRTPGQAAPGSNQYDRGEGPGGLGRRGRNGKLDESQAGLNYIDDINIPLGYFVLDTIEAQLHDIFFQRDEVWQYAAVNPADSPSVEKLGAKIRAAGKLFDHNTELKNGLHCAIKYNEAWTVPSWETQNQIQYYKNADGQRAEREVFQMEGPGLTNVSPYRIIRDPMVAPDRPNQMRFLGSWKPIAKLDLSRDYDIPASELKENAYEWMWPGVEKRVYSEMFSSLGMENYMSVVADLYIDLVPADHGLSDSDRPEVWHIALAGYDKLLKCRPAKFPTGKYPYFSNVPSGDGIDANPVGVMELIRDMIAMYNWLHAVRMAAVRNDLSGVYLVNERLIRVEDMEQIDPHRGGGVIRLARAAWQNPNAMENAIKRLAFTHDTQDWAQDSAALFEMIKIISGVVDPVSGIGDDASSRRTAEEINRTAISASKRIKKLAGRVHDQWLRPLGTALALLTQAFSKEDVMVQDAKGNWIKVSWDDILVPVSVTVGDGFLMKDPAQLAQSWQLLMQYINANPKMANMFKMAKMIEELGRAIGISNLADFISPEGVAAERAGSIAAEAAGGTGAQSQSATPQPQPAPA